MAMTCLLRYRFYHPYITNIGSWLTHETRIK